MTGYETTTCMVCGRGIIVHPVGDTFSSLVKKYGGAKNIPEDERIFVCKSGEEAALIEARHYESLARKARKIADLNKFLQKKGISFSDV